MADLRVVTDNLPDAFAGQRYRQTLKASGNSGPVTWSVTPNLPSALDLDPKTGIIEGVPSAISDAVTYTFTADDGTSKAQAALSFGVSAGQAMTNKSAAWIAVYLGAASVVALALVISLWSSRPDAPTLKPESCGSSSQPSFPDIDPMFPDTKSTSSILLGGCFPAKSSVTVNGASRSSVMVDQQHIVLSLNASDLASAGPLVVAVNDGSGKEIGSRLAYVDPSIFNWSLFGIAKGRISSEIQVLLLILFVGSFGSTVYALKSLADYRGEGKLYRSWMLYYGVQPIEGAGAAFLFYLLIRGGFLTATGTDTKSLNQFGICAIAALAGTFSDMAFMKMREMFQTIFKPQDDRSGKVQGIKISTTSLQTGKVGQPYDGALKCTGGTAPLKWAVNPSLPAGLTLSPSTGQISGTPSVVSPQATFCFSVTDSGTPPASAWISISLQVVA